MSQKPPSPLYEHIGYWLRYVSNHVSHSFARKVEAHGVTVAEWVILRELLQLGDVSPSRMADHLGMTRGAITKLADRLMAKGFVVRAVNADDRRWQTLQITAAGRALVPDLAELADENDQHFFGALDPQDRTDLERILKILVRQHDLKTIPTE
ncbi:MULTISPECIES: MarR family winged helix-turn-helix transcriptional regulator [Asticcacaulis]|uniref:MarR family winged helix-turn-helix transcriptional regulator n=1 Tax=Asticcacaulis TaxID=76890 RepID=UPI001AE6BFCC|nr:MULTISPECIES: MarR family winged helix-turn-helix transcriptional regulator [Asticcacaulis]MBP2159916.1 DNA-binding MarR family transcriptional regulator [Asticcacaulis solisilvae]MDR6800961.1 DNA-binding MarR family transcriptional regulator [Asticcacaulis sp. BE141]